MLAEDSEDDAFFFSRAWKKQNLPSKLVRVLNGEEGRTFITAARENRSDLPDLLILDIQMPVCDGFELLTWVRKQPELKRTPVMMWRSSERPEDRATAVGFGANGYFRKPGCASGLSAMLTQLLAEWRMHRERHENQSC